MVLTLNFCTFEYINSSALKNIINGLVKSMGIFFGGYESFSTFLFGSESSSYCDDCGKVGGSHQFS